jgi:hypothetical protein
VVCNGAPCADATNACCVTADLAGGISAECIADVADCPAGLSAGVGCDGAEDCQADEDCCLDGSLLGGGLTATCVADGTCGEAQGSTASVVCTSVNDCQPDELCCGLDIGFDIPVDIGTCAPAANNCSLN